MTKSVELNKFDATQWYLSNYELFENGLNGHRSAFHETRRQAIRKFSDLGFPTPRHEEWKYTNVTPILRHKFGLASKVPTVSASKIKNFIYEGLEHHLVVFVNGRYSEALSRYTSGSRGVVIENLQQALNNRFDLVGKHLGRYASFEDETFTALNTAFTHDGIFVFVPENVQVEEPLQILYLTDASEAPVVTYPRNLIVVEKGAGLQFIESFHGLSEHRYFNNAVTEVLVSENAHVAQIKIQEEGPAGYHIANTWIHQERHSVYNSVNIDFGGALVRNNLNVRLNAENCETHLYGFYFGKDKQHIDNHTFIDHAMPNCFSNELYKGILGDHATGVFNGKILVRPDAQKTNALQSNKTLLLTNDASVNAKPQLEIFADDVRCTHGATIGQLDDEAKFYLRARGIGEEVAEAMLRYAFVSDVFENIPVESVRKKLDAEMIERLKATERES